MRAPAWRASLSAMATACLRLRTLAPDDERRLPSLYSRITLPTFRCPLDWAFIGWVLPSAGDRAEPAARPGPGLCDRDAYLQFFSCSRISRSEEKLLPHLPHFMSAMARSPPLRRAAAGQARLRAATRDRLRAAAAFFRATLSGAFFLARLL